MFRIVVLALTILISFAALSCQSYSTGLQRSVQRADETAAISALHTVTVAQQTYSATTGGDFGTFQQLTAGGYLDPRFDSNKPQMKDYVLTMEVKPKAEGQSQGFYSCNADPEPAGGKVGSHFYADSTSPELHVHPDRPATASDPILRP
ncbi:MAG TPA: hypothetical protein VIF64_07625 [Pyrinomonadaceae bacterium]|jgi:Tfp pilus assembly protein PilE